MTYKADKNQGQGNPGNKPHQGNQQKPGQGQGQGQGQSQRGSYDKTRDDKGGKF